MNEIARKHLIGRLGPVVLIIGMLAVSIAFPYLAMPSSLGLISYGIVLYRKSEAGGDRAAAVAAIVAGGALLLVILLLLLFTWRADQLVE